MDTTGQGSEEVIDIFAIFVSIITLLQFVAYGQENRLLGPIAGIIVSLVWVLYALVTDQWGLQILNVGGIIIHSRNVWKWIDG